ncbi:MAG TPA: hypothetical protein VMF08_10420 [Candidatus Sulfotelmatobacter sp.]|nr:hypothetical protein [Candidatus Sulfotelmatobacter sp.]
MTPAPMPYVPLEIQLMEALREAGATIPDGAIADRLIQKILDDLGDQRAADAIARIFARLPGGKHGDELRHALGLALDCDSAELARRNGESKQSWGQRVKRLRERIFKKRLPGTPI